jgi:MFS family permease
LFSERNLLVVSLSNGILLASYFLYGTYWSLYLLELGATAETVGLWFTIQGIFSFTFQLSGGIFADRYGRKKVYVASTVFRMFNMVLYLGATTWQELIPGLIVDSMADMYIPALDAIVAESLPSEKRGAAFGVYRTISSIPQILMPFVSGVIVERLGIFNGTRTALIIMLVVSSIFIVIRAKLMRETLKINKIEKRRTIIESFSYLFKAKRSLVIMLITFSLFNFAFRLLQPFTTIYAVEIVNFTLMKWGHCSQFFA